MTYFFSPSQNAFYDGELQDAYDASNTWPEDAVEVSQDIFQKYTSSPPDGKVRGIITGEPGWVDIPPLSSEENVMVATSKKNILISEASAVIAPLQDAVDLEMSTSEEEGKLKKWKIYRVLLNRVNVSAGSEITWPNKP